MVVGAGIGSVRGENGVTQEGKKGANLKRERCENKENRKKEKNKRK